MKNNLTPMTPPRQTGHRPKRETQDIRAKEVAQLRAENQRLKRLNARLRREIEKRVSIEPILEDAPEPTLAETEPKKEAGGFKCPECGGNDFTSLQLGPRTFLICKDCKWRKAQ